MYSWDGDTSGWYGKARYSYSSSGAAARESAAKRARASGGRSYSEKAGPTEALVDARKYIKSESKNPLIVAIDVTGSMARWPFEIFDRLPLLFNTLSQYREDVEISFVAIGDARYDRWPLQTTDFASGYDLEQLLNAIYGEGGGGDGPEGYGLFAHWVNTHVQVPNVDEKPFLIVFGDAPMHEDVKPEFIQNVLGDPVRKGVNAIDAWQKTSQNWNVWFLRRPTGREGDRVDKQWAKAIGEQKIFHIKDEARAVDFAMGLVARAWGMYGDFRTNMAARQDEATVEAVSQLIAMKCPVCGGPIPVDAAGMFTCGYCGTTLKLS